MFVWSIVLFLIGLAVGSFINVAAARYRPEKFLLDPSVIGGRSRCPHCHRQLRWFELVPVLSFLFLRGRCRSCLRPISGRYPTVETLTGLVFLLPVYFYGYFHIAQRAAAGELLVWYYWFSAAWVVAGIALIALSVIDWRLYIIPDETTAALAGAGLLIAALAHYYRDAFGWSISFVRHYAALIELPMDVFWQHLAAGAAGLIFFGLVFVLTKGRGMGFGDVKLAGAIGLLLGWPDAVLAFSFSFVFGSLVGLLLLMLGRKKFRQPIPFGPYLALGVMTVVLFGYQLVEKYFTLFGIF